MSGSESTEKLSSGEKEGKAIRPRSKSTLSKLVGQKVAKSLSSLPGSDDAFSSPGSSSTPAPQAVSVFNQSIPSAPELLEDGVPKVVFALCKYILEDAAKTEGLFRITPSQGDVKRCIATFEEGRTPDFDQIGKGNNVAAAVLKHYFRGLPEPLLTYELHDMFIAASGVPDQETRLVKIRQVISYLPSQNYSLLLFLVLFLREMTKFASETKMNAENLAIVFAPNLLRPKNVAKDEATDTPYGNQLIQSMIEELERVFEGYKCPKFFSDNKDGKKDAPTPAKESKDKKPKGKVIDNQDIFFDDVRHARIDNVKKLLENNKIELDAFDGRGWSALMMAVHRSDISMMQLLLQSGSGINLQNDRKESALLRAVSIGSVEAVRFLLENGAKHEITNDDGLSPLHTASYAGELEICSLLLQNKAVVDLRDPSRKTPLILAAYAGHKDVCALLLDNGASLSKHDEYGWTPLMMSAFAGHTEVVSLLIDRGASTSASNKKGKTASMLAAEASKDDVVKILGTSKPKKKSSRRHSTGKNTEEGHGDMLTVSTGSSSKSKSKHKSPQVDATGDADHSSGSPSLTPRSRKGSKKEESQEAASAQESAPVVQEPAAAAPETVTAEDNSKGAIE